MFQHLIVAVDGSKYSWRALPVAVALAGIADAKVEVVTVIPELEDLALTEKLLRDDILGFADIGLDPIVTVLRGEVAPTLAAHAEAVNGSMMVMTSHGHGRSAAVLGSVPDEVLRLMFGPIIVVGPETDSSDVSLDRPYVVPVDGSRHAEAAAPLAAAWAIEFGAVPWLVEVLDPGTRSIDDVFESGYAARLAQGLAKSTAHEIEFEVLHDQHPGRAIGEFAARMDAGLVFASTHGRTGMARLRLGSVAAEIVRNAPCPIVLCRPPVFAVD